MGDDDRFRQPGSSVRLALALDQTELRLFPQQCVYLMMLLEKQCIPIERLVQADNNAMWFAFFGEFALRGFLCCLLAAAASISSTVVSFGSLCDSAGNRIGRIVFVVCQPRR
jgi:hypothetical protein